MLQGKVFDVSDVSPLAIDCPSGSRMLESGSMIWVGYALLSAFSLATADALSKRCLLAEALRSVSTGMSDVYLMAWARLLFAVPWLLLLLFFIDIPSLAPGFWWTIALMVPLELLALVLYVKALQVSPLSLTLPFLSLTPVFLLGTALVILGEIPSRVGAAGMFCVVAGAFLLHAHAWKEGWLAPLRLIWSEPGSRYMIIVAFLYSVTSSLGKQAIFSSSPVFFALIYFLVLLCAFTPIVMGVVGWRELRNVCKRDYVLIGWFEALMMVFHVLAIVQVQVSYMIAVKRTSMLFGLGYGAWWFGERELAGRLWGSLVMLCGVVLMVLG